MSTWRDYVIAPDDRHWPTLLADWSPPLPGRYTVWMANLFGHVFVTLDEKSVHRLDIEVGSLDRLADSRAEFLDLLEQGDNFNQWYMVALVDRCVAAGMRLRFGECYGLIIQPMLSGPYDVSNIRVVSMAEYYRFTASTQAQVKNIPPGSEVVIKIVD